MALDEAILLSISEGASPPTLRLYAWDPPCLSLGYSQSVEDVDLGRLAEAGWDLVRRPTGGRAILHADELTYSVALPASHPLTAGGVLASFRRLSSALQEGLSQMGLDADINPELRSPGEEPPNPVCFEVPSAYEITVAGRKLVGSAQLRRLKGILQHGSIPLAGDLGRICSVLRFANDGDREQAASELRRRASTVEAALGTRVTWDEAAQAIARGFDRAFGIELQFGEISPEEKIAAARLRSERYAQPDWIERGQPDRKEPNVHREERVE